ncbi:flagellar hook-associated protein FlgL [Paenibacillus sp. MBLB4367]|uniref:flagellar hook-associated protein FlgL n=1 Tax=Paenibacillus sp. MBLB4367 TaxID=3384767 RepID=UPI0039080FCB
MGTRVTQSMLNSQMLRNINSNMNRMQTLQDQLSTGRKINKPSDDPVGISFSMRYRSDLNVNEQYESNVAASQSWMDYTDTMMDQAGKVLHRVRELAVSGANGTNSKESLEAMRIEVEQMYGQMVNIGNSQFNGKYVFNGQLTDIKPFPDENDAMNAVTDTKEIQFEIGLGVRMAVNKTAEQVFGVSGTENNVYKVFKDLSKALGDQDSAGVSTALSKLDERLDAFLGVRADVGAKSNRIQLAADRLQDIDVNVTSLLSKTEDADIAKVITNLKMDENVYQASLSAGSRLIQPSLLDFLR